jgi:uncharacterized protein (DUF2344 family)
MSTLLSTTPGTDTWQAGFMQIMPAIQTHLKIQFRQLPAERREEATQEAIASACASYRMLAVKGRLADAHPSTLAAYAVNYVHNHRHLGGSQDAARDAMSVIAQARHRFRTISYDRYKDDVDAWEQMNIVDKKASVSDLACFRVDFRAWLKTLTRRDRQIIAAFIRGSSTMAVAEQFGISEGRVSQLRRKYETLWRAFQRQAIVLAA